MTFEVWTAAAVEGRIVEAAETLMQTPNVGFAAGGGMWPEYVRDYPKPMKTRVRPSPAALQRMEETWVWVNSILPEEDRKLIYAWSWFKARTDRKVAEFASREGMNSRTLRRAVVRICQRIANSLNQKRVTWQTVPVDAVSDPKPVSASERVSSPNHATHWRDPSAKPFHLPDSPDMKQLERRLRKNRRDADKRHREREKQAAGENLSSEK